jgi:transposase-like protein
LALEALRGNKKVQKIAAKRQRHPTQVSTWKRQTIDGLTGVFSDKVKMFVVRVFGTNGGLN